MTPFEIVGFALCLFAIAFITGFGLMCGAWAGIHAWALAFGALNINIIKHVRATTDEA